jgi:hypothetical protein
MKQVEQLRKLAQSNPAADAVFHSFAMRKRTRRDLPLKVLNRRMRLVGFKFSREQYAEVLVAMSNLGFGQLYRTTRGKVHGLRNIPVTLQSIGETAFGGKYSLKENREPRAKIEKLAVEPETQETTNSPIVLTFLVHGKAVNVSIPKDMTTKDVTEIVETLSHIGG